MKKLIPFIALIIIGFNGHCQKNDRVIISLNKPGPAISPKMWGIFFEDINFAADGGIYAELVKNRSFEFDAPMMGWKEISLQNGKGHSLVYNTESVTNAHYISLFSENPEGSYGICNEGYRGMGVRSGSIYNFSVLARNTDPGSADILIQLQDPEGKVIGESLIKDISGDWKKYTASITCSSTTPKASLAVILKGKSNLDLDMISLFPADTWKNRPNGLRKDLVQLLADLKPGFIRFPGGCIVEGRILSNRYQWKNTVGEPILRKTIINRWNTEFSSRSTPDYFQSFGLGFYEYFQLSEDIGAEPLPILNCGMACQFNSSELVPLNQLDPYVQDALDLIEFANGTSTSKWGAIRTSMGHPEPFHLKMIGVGNEQWGPQYFERYKIFVKAIKEKYPEIKIVTGSGPGPDDNLFHFAWGELRKLNADLVDEHYYKNPQWFLQNANRYDNYDRKGPKVFAGEYASHVKTQANNWEAALSEAAFMTGLERNADVVRMASYAPLFAHVDAWQWHPDLIWYDNLKSFGTPDYYVQKMYSTNNGEFVVPALLNGAAIEGKDSLYMSASIQKSAGTMILKIVNTASHPVTLQFGVEGAKKMDKKALKEEMSSPDLSVENSINQPEKIVPVTEEMKLEGKNFACTFKPKSFTILKIKVK